WRRTYFFHSEGWEKDGDPNVACSRTVEPLPYRGMEGYPCEGGTGPLAQRPGERTRWVAGDRLARRVEVLGPRHPSSQPTLPAASIVEGGEPGRSRGQP
ncbi:MAG: hypothetical protein GY953_20795, partial [bacterium]|nr:hypothetical protein [bacterium]